MKTLLAIIIALFIPVSYVTFLHSIEQHIEPKVNQEVWTTNYIVQSYQPTYLNSLTWEPRYNAACRRRGIK